MPKITATTTPLVKAMLIGDSKSGKTTALASLVLDLGLHLHILDMDCKINPSYLTQLIRATDPSKLDLIDYQAFRDGFTIQTATSTGDPTVAMPMVPKIRNKMAYTQAANALNKWDDDTNPADWGPNHVFVVDTLNTLSQAAFNQAYALSPNTRDARIWYNGAQTAVNRFMSALWHEDFKTNVLVLSHITDIPVQNDMEIVQVGSDRVWKPKPGAETKGYPTTIGQALSRTVALWTNELWELKSTPKGIRTVGVRNSPRLDLGTAVVGGDNAFPAESGLATIFKTLRGN